jgi:hypothetical protein
LRAAAAPAKIDRRHMLIMPIRPGERKNYDAA